MRWRLAAGLAVIAGVVFAEPPEVVTTAHIPLAERAQAWGLSEAEFRRYQRLMAGQRGQWSPGLDPIAALGVSTDSEVERRRFAELFVKTEFERTRKEIAFQVAVDQAWQRLYPGTPRLVAAGQPRQTNAAGQSFQRTALILRLGNTAGRDRLSRLLQRQPGQLVELAANSPAAGKDRIHRRAAWRSWSGSRRQQRSGEQHWRRLACMRRGRPDRRAAYLSRSTTLPLGLASKRIDGQHGDE